MENIIVKICKTCNINTTKKSKGKYCQICLSARNNKKLNDKGYYKEYYQKNKDKIINTYKKKGLKPETELSKEKLYQRQYYLKRKDSLKINP